MPERDPTTDKIDLAETYLDLAEGGAVHRIPVDEGFWPRLMGGEIEPDRLMAVFEMGESMRHWEMHPAGEEVIVALSGDVDFVLEDQPGARTVTLAPGDTLVVPRGTWHRVVVRTPARLIFVTWGRGTEHRPMERAEDRADGSSSC